MRIIIGTGNNGKVEEFKRMFYDMGNKINGENIEVVSLKDVGFNEEIDEFGLSLYQNSLIKAEEIQKRFPEDIIITDDSGLFVEQLNFQPGVKSARFSEGEENYEDNKDKMNNLKLLRLLGNNNNRNSFFATVLCMTIPGREPLFFKGKLNGEIAYEIYEGNGFGYDPVFLHEHQPLSSFSMEEKNEISHRGKALVKLREYLADIDLKKK